MKVIAMNRKDRLEDFIWKNKGDFDVVTPSGDLWSRIENDLDKGGADPNPQKKSSTWLWAMIGLILFMLTAYTFYNLGNEKSDEKSMLFAEVDEIELYFERQSQLLVKTVSNDYSILQDPDLEEINNYIDEIKRDLEKMPRGSEEKALHALMESYKTKLMITERLLKNYENTESKNSDEYNI